MQTLRTIELVGSRQSRATNWMVQAGYARAILTDGSSIYCGDVSPNRALAMVESQGIDCADYKARLAESLKPFEPSPEERAATHYQDRYGYSVPESMGEWSYSHTFGRWTRLVTFRESEGPVWTFPKR